MHPSEKVVYLNSQIMCARAEIEGMIAENQYRAYFNQAPAYTEENFNEVIERYHISHDNVVNFLHQNTTEIPYE